MLLGKSARVFVLLLLAGMLSPTGQVNAQTSVDIDRIRSGADRHGFLTFQGTYVPGPGHWNFGLHLDYLNEPLNLRSGDGSEASLIDHRMRADLRLQLGLLGRMSLGLNIPFVMYQTGDSAALSEDLPALSSVSPADPQLLVRYRFFGEDSRVERELPGGPGLALLAAMTFPVGEHDAFVNENGVTTDLQLIADFHVLGLGAGLALGWKHRFVQGQIGDVEFGDELSLGLGLKIPVPWIRGMGAQLGYQLITAADAPFDGSSRTSSEGQIALTYIRGDYAVRVGAGRGFNDGVGTPRVRAFMTLDWAPRVRDSDGDGIPDDRDQCGSPEDYDGFEDSDGCRDPDNDGDLVLDIEDACPNEASDENRDADEDGCTDPVVDRDEDGVEDASDSCPAQAEDRDGHDDEDGCPDPDNDGDGVEDQADSCPNDAEDADGFQDSDGCPELDNDEDQVPDSDDQCPLEAEDRDEYQDSDGCPDPDHDRDGVIDAEDQCPTTTETINGRQDGDGCPDRGRGVWRSSGQEGEGRLEITGRMRLGDDGSVPGGSRSALEQLARHLIAAWPTRLQLRVAGEEGLDLGPLRTALEEAGAPMSRVEMSVDTSLGRGQVILTAASHMGG